MDGTDTDNLHQGQIYIFDNCDVHAEAIPTEVWLGLTGPMRSLVKCIVQTLMTKPESCDAGLSRFAQSGIRHGLRGT